jgi:mannitol/fructose-specific phosphotransferase system IIA component (Ntr-type)
MNITDVLEKENIKIDLDINNKKSVIDELLKLLISEELTEDILAGIKEDVLEREEIMSTGIGKGIGLPHCKTDKVDRIYLAIGRNKTGIDDYDTLDDEPVKLIFLLISPSDNSNEHINMLARISRIVKMDYVRSNLLTADTSKKIFDIIKNEDKKFL